jgi:ATPase subunit of ABC transporter with duplicated ATPase domains
MRIRSWVHRTTAMASQPHTYPSVAVEMQQFSSASVAPSAATQIAKDSVELIFREVGYQVQVATTATKKCACAPPYSEDLQTKKILKGVTGIIRPQRITCILGASGAGKTSLLNILSGSLVSGSLSGQLVRHTFPPNGSTTWGFFEPLVILFELTRVFRSS